MRFSVYCLAFKTYTKQNLQKNCMEETVNRLSNNSALFWSIYLAWACDPIENHHLVNSRSTLIKYMTSVSYKHEPAIWSRGTGQRITWFDRCQLIIIWYHISKMYKVNQGCMSLSNYYLEDGHHLARLHRRRRRRRAYAPTSNTTSHDNHEKINSWVSLSFYMGIGLRLAALRFYLNSQNFPPF